MATWMLATTFVGTAGSFAPARAAGPAPLKQTVKLNVQLNCPTAITGGELVIKPGHPACRFKPVAYPIKLDRQGMMPDILPIDVETLSADRDASFLFVLKEPGQPDKVFRRSLQLAVPTAATAGKPQSLNCYLSSNSGMVQAEPSVPRAATAAKPAGTVRK